MDAKKLLEDYEYGCGFKYGDVLVPRDGVCVSHYDVIEETVVVLYQDALVSHQYKVVGEKFAPSTPAYRFVKFIINGHDWKKK